MNWKVELGDYFEWNGQIVKCEWINEGSRSIGFVTKEPCPCCGEELTVSNNHIESSPNFQKEAKPIQTIKSLNQEIDDMLERKKPKK